MIPSDQRARDIVTHEGLDRTLFVEAGAGTGKTTALVSRIVELVITGRARVAEIAAITFTDAAASELRDRIRDRFEAARHEAEQGGDQQQEARCRVALEELDAAAIATLHAFAQRILNEHPVLVGIPPRVEVLDEVQSQLEAEKRWGRFLDDLYDHVDAEELLMRAEALQIKFTTRTNNGPRAVARVLDDNWDRIDELADAPNEELSPIDWTLIDDVVSSLVRLADECDDVDDALHRRIRDNYVGPLRIVRAAQTDIERLELLTALSPSGKVGNVGRSGNWPDVTTARAVVSDAAEAIVVLKERVADDVLGQIAVRLARFTRASALARAAEGRLEFHDLLVLARRLLRDHPVARAELRDRYAKLLLDEFQDTDPIQIEIAVLIASSFDDVATKRWDEYEVEAGRLFFVGDPKQSIYRFRRADIGLFLAARRRFAPDQPLALTQNFRTVEPIIEWVNEVFGEQLRADDDDPASVGYVPLEAMRGGHDHLDHRPLVVGGPHPDPKVRAAELRRIEAEQIALAIAQIREEPRQWLVQERDSVSSEGPVWRAARLRDITILIPTRTSLPFLQRALHDLELPFRADTGTLLFDQPEIRAVRSVLAAVADPGDQIAVVAALRSALFACSDDELLSWHAARGRWDYRATFPSGVREEHPVARAMTQLRGWHDQRWWMEPSAMIDMILRERHAFAAAFFDRRPRDAWRRMRYLIEQARAFQESGGGDLRAFLEWVDLQGKDGARAHEPTLDERDDDAVRIMTIHGSKGLEFPITVVSGLTTQQGTGPNRGVQVVWPADGGKPEIKLSKKLATGGFDRLAEVEGQMDIAEKKRLLYVACTRAQDHLIVSGVHNPDKLSHARVLWEHADNGARHFEPPLVAPGGLNDQLAFPVLEDTAAARATFIERRDALLAEQSVPTTLSATAVARLGGETIAAGEDDAVVDLAEPTVLRRGRAGTAIGRAVHAVLQSVDFAAPGDCEALARSLAHSEAVPWAAQQIAASVRQTLRTSIVQQAVESGRYWKELFVAVPVGDVTLEGYVDLLVETEAGLVVVDYKTDAFGTEADIAAKVGRYRLQAATYAVALEASTAKTVVDAVFVFAQPDRAVERRVDDLAAAMAEVRQIAIRRPSPSIA